MKNAPQSSGLIIKSSEKISFNYIVNEIVKSSSLEDRFIAAIDHQKKFEKLIKGVESFFVNKDMTRAINHNHQEKLELLRDAVESSLLVYKHLVSKYETIGTVKNNQHFFEIIEWWMSTYFRLYILLASRYSNLI